MNGPDTVCGAAGFPDISGQRVLITGASGFLGSHLSARLSAAGAELYAVSRTARRAGPGKVRWLQADIEDLETTRRLLLDVNPDVIFHLGGRVNGAPDLNLVVETFHSLVTTTVNLLTVAADLRCQRVLLVGSLDEPVAETGEACPASPYGAAKWATSAYGRMFHKLFKVPVVIVRPYMTYGPGQPDWKVIPYAILSLLRGERPALGRGDRELDWIYIDDTIDGLLLAGWTPDLEGATLEFGSGKLTTIRDIVGRLAQLVAPALGPLEGEFSGSPRNKERAANIVETRARTGWSPTTSLYEGLERTVEWYRRHGMPPESEHT